MADIAHLGLSVEYQDADKAALALTRMSAAAKKAEDAAAGVAGASGKAAKAAATITAGTSKARIEWETYDEVVARTGSKIKDAAQSADDAAKSVKGHGEAANDAAKGMKNASLAAQGFSVALGKVKEVIGGFILNAVTVAVGVLIAELAKLVDWAQWAKAGLYTLADAIEAVAPYASMAAAGMALLYAPAILSGIAAVTVGIYGIVKALGTAALAFAAANPATAFVLGITAAVAAANIFRDELAEIFARDVVADAKKAVNFIIGAFVGGYNAVVDAWGNLPTFFSAIGKSAWNNLVAEFEKPALTINGQVVIPGLNLSGLKSKKTPAEDAAMKGATARFDKAAFDTDYLGATYDVIERGASAAADKLRALADGLGKTEKAKKKAKSEAEKLAEKYDRLVTSATEFIRAQELEASVIGMTEQAANALRYEQDLLNEARRAGLKLTDADKQGFKALADSMAEAEERTRVLRDAFDFTKDTVKGFFSDLRSGLDQGKSFWDAFADAAVNALNKIAEKLIDMALDQMINNVFQGLMGAFGGAGYSPAASAAINAGVGGLYADGGYTGPGAASQPAGIVHAGEYVMSKRAVDRLGIGYLDALHNAAKGYQTGGLVTPFYSAANSNLPGFDRGGYVPSAPSYAYAGNAGSRAVNPSNQGGAVRVVVNNYGEPAEASVHQSTDADGNTMIEVMMERKIDDRVLRSSSPVHRQLKSMGLQTPVTRR